MASDPFLSKDVNAPSLVQSHADTPFERQMVSVQTVRSISTWSQVGQQRCRKPICDLALQYPQWHEAAGKVMVSLRHHWHGLIIFMAHPEITLDNRAEMPCAVRWQAGRIMMDRAASGPLNSRPPCEYFLPAIQKSSWRTTEY